MSFTPWRLLGCAVVIACSSPAESIPRPGSPTFGAAGAGAGAPGKAGESAAAAAAGAGGVRSDDM